MTDAPSGTRLANIGPEGAARRRRAAYVAAGVAVAALAVLDVLDLPHHWRALLLLPLWFAALAWLQASART